MLSSTPTTWLKLATLGPELVTRRGLRNPNVTCFETIELRHTPSGECVVTLRNNVYHSKVDYTGQSWPARVWFDGQRVWYMNGYLHRDPINEVEQPVDLNGSQRWYVKSNLYRSSIDGIEQPSIVSRDGDQWCNARGWLSSIRITNVRVY